MMKRSYREELLQAAAFLCPKSGTIALFGALILLVSCQSGEWLGTKNFAETAWKDTDTLTFEFYNPSAATRNLDLSFDFAADYPYQNIWLQLIVTDPKGKVQTILLGDTLMDLAGIWKGQPEVGSTVKWDWESPTLIELPSVGTYRFGLIQYMREEQLAGIKSVRIGLE